jgi:hypothetical protein
MKIHVVTRKAIAAAALSASTAAGFGAVAVGSAAVATAAPAKQKTAPISFCSVFGGELPVIGRLPYCKKKVPEKMEVPPVSVPIER